MEDFTAMDAQIDPGNSQIIGETQLFEIERLTDRMLAVTTDAGRVLLGFRTEGSENIR